ncbi:hypothetical protein Cgig2_006587 [Carnegiea gigantea]|uniref:Uncharacterized protein n=1 Tax=Carnegiea gigantea TaxID=171969 RepID=A0A9Q1KNU2_9CARY|nr:hypothetical protein Cgig2_006587 [Carnegiea gigantea]
MGELHIRFSAVLTTLIFGGPSVSVQGVGCLILWAVTITRRGDELDFFRISPLGFGPRAFIHVIEVGLEVGIILKFLGQRDHDLVQAPLEPGQLSFQLATLCGGLNPSGECLSYNPFLDDLLGLRVRGWLRGANKRTIGDLRSGPPGLRGGIYEREGLPLASYREAVKRALVQGKTFLVKHQPHVTTNRGEQGSCSHLLSLLINQEPSFLLPSALGVSYHLFSGDVPTLKDRQLRPYLLYIKRKRSQVKIKRKGRPTKEQRVPLEKCLSIKRLAATRKKLLAKNFNLGSQFRGSLSLDLLFFFSGPFTDSIARAINLGIG